MISCSAMSVSDGIQGRLDQRAMANPELPHALGDDVDQELLVGDHFGGVLQELGSHILQGTNAPRGTGRELQNRGSSVR